MARIIEHLVAFCINRPWFVAGATLVLAALGLFLTLTRFAINTDTTQMFSSDVPWLQNLASYDAAFPQNVNLIVAVIDGTTPEIAEEAAEKLAGALGAGKPIRGVRRPDGGPFLARSGLLFLAKDELTRTTEQLVESRDFLAPLAGDPSLRGAMTSLSVGLNGVKLGIVGLDELERPMRAYADVFERVLAGRPARLSWQAMLAQDGPERRDLRKLILVQPALDYRVLQPGAAAIDRVRAAVRTLGLTPENGVTVRLTGPVPLADEEFGTVAENIALNMGLTIAAVAAILFAALRSARLIIAVLATLFVGLIVTSGLGLLIVGELNLISIAFAVLFIGLGVDFGIQFAVRYRAERFARQDLKAALLASAGGVGGSLTLAAVSLLAGFFSFLPTDFRGVSELGLIAGMGMIIAYAATLTFLPALLVILNPPGEPEPVETAWLAVVDDWIAGHRRLILVVTAAVVVAGLPLLFKLPFDSNPMDLRSQKVESVATFLDLARNPETSPNSIEVLAPSLDAAKALSVRLSALPEVARTVDLATFIPDEQEAKLAIIRTAAGELRPVLAPARIAPAPNDAETRSSLQATATDLREVAATDTSEASATALRLADLLDRLAGAPPERRMAARTAVLTDFERLLERLRAAFTAEPITRDNLPAELVGDWLAPDGQARLEVFPKGNANDNATIARFADAVRAIAPNATGAPVIIVEAGQTVVRAFLEAGLFAFAAIFIILVAALRRPLDVALTLGPLVLAGIVSLEAAFLIGLPLNYANIIALPLMFGVGVAFHIYYVIAWRGGVKDMLASSLTRAIFFSALTTGTAFGSLCLSSHPGTASMGELLAISLFFTLVAAFIVVPAFLGPPREEPHASASAHEREPMKSE